MFLINVLICKPCSNSYQVKSGRTCLEDDDKIVQIMNSNM